MRIALAMLALGAAICSCELAHAQSSGVGLPDGDSGKADYVSGCGADHAEVTETVAGHGPGDRRISTTELALDALCPGHRDLAPHVDAAARQYMVHSVTLVAIMAKESDCRMDVVGAHGERCAMQLRGVARNGHSGKALAASPALCIATGARWFALRQVDCGGGLFLGLSGYNAKTCQGGKRYARKVLAKVASFWRAMTARNERRS
jgi:hypothetical protein